MNSDNFMFDERGQRIDPEILKGELNGWKTTEGSANLMSQPSFGSVNPIQMNFGSINLIDLKQMNEQVQSK